MGQPLGRPRGVRRRGGGGFTATLLAGLLLSKAISEVVLPGLEEVGDRWEAGTLSVAHEHFFTGIVTRRLADLTKALTTRTVRSWCWPARPASDTKSPCAASACC